MTPRARSIVVASLAAALMAAGGRPASAETVTCQLSASGSFQPGMRLIDGWSEYTFASPRGLLNETRCSHNGGPLLVSRVSTGGLLRNAVCGTAGLWSPHRTLGTTIDVGADGSPEVTSLDYAIDLVGWRGRLLARTVNGRPEMPNDEDGLLLFRPQHTCVFQPLEHYTVDGVFTLDW